VSTDDDLRDLTERHFRALVAECPPGMLLAVSIVIVEGNTCVRVALNSEVAECGPSPETLRDGLVRVLQEYLGACPNVLRQRTSSGGAPS
jgi:hypothetical protein